MPALDTPAAYAAAFASGRVAPVRGLAGRVLKGRVPADFASLSPDPARRVVFLMDHSGLARILGATADEALAEIGYTAAYVAAKRAQGARFELAVFPARADVFPATWDHVIDLAIAEWPDLGPRLRAHAGALAQRAFGDFVADSDGYPWAAVRDHGRRHPRFTSAAEYRRVPAPAAWQTRALLYCEFRLTDLFAGDGYTRRPDGSRGLAEWVTRNRPLAEFAPVARVPLG